MPEITTIYISAVDMLYRTIYDASMDRESPTRPPKTPPALSIYLGPEPLASKRLEALDALAGQLGTSRSKMIQMLADGKLMLVVARREHPESVHRLSPARPESSED